FRQISPPIFDSPSGIISTLGSSATSLNISDFADDVAFENNIDANYQTIFTGGVSFDFTSGSSMFAWQASFTGGMMGPTMLNLASNIALNRALNTSGQATGTPSLIQPTYQSFPATYIAHLTPLVRGGDVVGLPL
ncbi:hypothetical protein FB451DRAFT_792985, partial [Mycena latifolia]